MSTLLSSAFAMAAEAGDDAEGLVSIYGQCEAAWCDVSYTTSDGNTCTGVIKATFYGVLEDVGKPFCFWELRRVLHLLGYARADGLHKLIKELMSVFAELCEQYGHAFDEHFHHSLKAGRSLGIDLSTCVPEYEISTFLLQAFLLHTTLHARGDRRSRGEKLLHAWLCVVFPTPAHASRIVLHVDEGHFALCQREAVNGRCNHIAAQLVHSQMISSAAISATHQFKIASMLRSLWPRVQACQACSQWVEDLTTQITELVNELGMDLELFKTNLVEDGVSLVMHAAKRKRRMDNNLLIALVGSPGSKANNTTNALVRSHTKLYSDDTGGQQLDERFMCMHQAAGWLAFKDVGIVGLSIDAVRSGMPGKDSIVVFMTAPQKRIGNYGPPVDTRIIHKDLVVFG